MVVVRLMPLPFLSPYVTGGLIVLPLTIALAALSYHVIEGPFLMLRSRYVARSVQSVS
jgi:peptidoglycan/LPS O-acetylase OafA/YrhL